MPRSLANRALFLQVNSKGCPCGGGQLYFTITLTLWPFAQVPQWPFRGRSRIELESCGIRHHSSEMRQCLEVLAQAGEYQTNNNNFKCRPPRKPSSPFHSLKLFIPTKPPCINQAILFHLSPSPLPLKIHPILLSWHFYAIQVGWFCMCSTRSHLYSDFHDSISIQVSHFLAK